MEQSEKEHIELVINIKKDDLKELLENNKGVVAQFNAKKEMLEGHIALLEQQLEKSILSKS